MKQKQTDWTKLDKSKYKYKIVLSSKKIVITLTISRFVCDYFNNKYRVINLIVLLILGILEQMSFIWGFLRQKPVNDLNLI
jgi:hypothetical protein